MCSIIILRRPDHPWPIVIGANRDENTDRPWQPPARHWSDRPEVVAGLDELAGGTWLGVNDTGVMAAVLNRKGTLGPAAGKRSRGELVLEALDHSDAADAVEAMRFLAPEAYRPFNLVIADNRDAWFLFNDGNTIRVAPVPEGVTMLTSTEPDDMAEPRIRLHRPRFAAATPPDPEADSWQSWIDLLTSGDVDAADDVGGSAMCFRLPSGYGTVSSSLIALPAIGREEPHRWLFSAGPPCSEAFHPVVA